MKNQLFILFIVISSFNCYSQISFEKGYYIDNSGEKIDCFIKGRDWKNNPVEFEYKLQENTETKKAGINEVKEFGIYDVFKYRSYTVDIDRSSNLMSEMGGSGNPIFQQEQLFLEILVEGNATLFSYKDRNLKRYFYKTEDSEIEQLVFKRFKTQDAAIAENNLFRQQLWKNLKCQNISMMTIEKVDYRKNELINFFIRYNECKNSKFNSFKSNQKKDFFNLGIKAQLNSSSLQIKNSNSSDRNTDFGGQTSIRVGAEFEFILPFNKNKWSVFLEPTYQQYKSEGEITVTTPTTPLEDNVKVDYSSIEVPLGIRHYMFLTKNSKLYINGAIVIDFDSNSIVNFERLPDLEIVSNNNLILGLGYKFKNRYSIEARYGTNRDILSTQSGWNSEYNSLGLVLGYTIF